MEELTPLERELYLRDFLPPDSTMRITGSKRREVYRIARHYEPVAEDDSMVVDNHDDSWEEEE